MAREWTGWDKEEEIYSEQTDDKNKFTVKKCYKGSNPSYVLEPMYMSPTGWKNGTRKVIGVRAFEKILKAVESSLVN
ncbi:hypothetical protein [Bacillus phage Hakuna]|uniref:DNA binding protein n=1 Tax=Bacillus phage Hakuna TaxID=1486659 RepID=A0A024B1M9_9CAUD|nr:hypothetical protein FP72_gp254 [Bacillus phage Hakuna]AHZ10272.1 hypothetical protein [Bacillus phage Hakuna]